MTISVEVDKNSPEYKKGVEDGIAIEAQRTTGKTCPICGTYFLGAWEHHNSVCQKQN